jgi:hypothetical protein
VTPRLPFWPATLQPPCLSREPKVRVAINHVFQPSALQSSHHRITLLIDSVCTLVNVVIINPIRVDLVL